MTHGKLLSTESLGEQAMLAGMLGSGLGDMNPAVLLVNFREADGQNRGFRARLCQRGLAKTAQRGKGN